MIKDKVPCLQEKEGKRKRRKKGNEGGKKEERSLWKIKVTFSKSILVCFCRITVCGIIMGLKFKILNIF